MGMRMHGWGGGGYASNTQNTQNALWQQRRQSFNSLAQAISGGNLANANAAFTQIQAAVPAGGSINPNGFLGQIGAALQSGDITAAQQVLAARFNGMGDQASTTAASQQAGATTTAGATSASGVTSSTGVASTTGATSGAGAAYGHHGHHHHHGGGGSSPAMDLSQAIQSGDTAKAQSSMQTILTDLQQVASMGSLANPATSTASPSAAVSSVVSAANNLLQNPDFQALEAAVTNGDATGMQTAWAKLISGASSASATTSAAAATTVATTTTPPPAAA